MPIPEGETVPDGSAEANYDEGDFSGAVILHARVILGGNGLWTAYVIVSRKTRLKYYRRHAAAWLSETVKHHYHRPQFTDRGDAIAWCEFKWVESLGTQATREELLKSL
jgi:hypothetical protein